jgi:hypothetical protein
MLWPKAQPRSLRRLAVQQQAEAERIGRVERAWRRSQRWAWKLFHDRLWCLLLPVAAVLIAFVPAGVSLRPFRGLHQAPNFLEVLWQVQAATLALSLAVVIFIFEAVYSARPRPSIRDLAEGVRLPAIFYAGLGGLALTGMVLLGAGSGAPGGWAATWAVIWAALSGIGLIALFVAMLRDIEPDALYARWLAQLREQVEEAIEAEILQRVAINLLNDLCQRLEIEFHPIFGSWGGTQLQEINASRGGVVQDINLWRVAKAARLSIELDVGRAHGNEKPAILVYLGGGIGKGQAMMRVARVVAGLAGLEQAFQIVERDPRAGLDVALTQLHDEAVRLIGDGSPGAYARITEVYEHLLLAQPETWARYGQRFGPDVAVGVHPFALTLLDRVERRLYEELELAVLSPSREIGRDALNLPIAVAFRTIELRAIALAGRMLRLLAAIEDALIRAPASDKQGALFGNSWLRLSEYGRAVERLVTEDESSEEDRAYGVAALRQVFEAYAVMAKSLIDHSPRETDSLSEINRYLDTFLRHWDPEHERPDKLDVEYLVARGDVQPRELERLRSQLADKQARVALKDELTLWRAAHRFALLAWCLRRLRESEDTAYVEAWNAFVGYFGDVEGTARVVDHALETDSGDGSPWSSWGSTERPMMSAARYVGIGGELLQAFVVVALNRTNPDGAVPQIPPFEWLATGSDSFRQEVEDVLAQQRLRQLLPAERLEDRAEKVIAAIEAMRRARDQQEDQRVIDAPLDRAAVEAFRDAVRTAWEASRLIGPALVRVGMYETPDGAPPDGTRFGIEPERTLKGLFTPEPRIHGADMRARDIGRELAAGEIKDFAELARDSAEVVAYPAESLAETLRRAIVEVRQDEEELIVLVPSSWRLTQSLELTLAKRRGGKAEPPRWVPKDASESFVGTADGVLVFDSHELPPDRLLVIALNHFARWRQWKADEEHELLVSVIDYDDDAARALVERNPKLFRTEERTTVEARAREVRKTVLLDVFERFAIEVVDAHAARWVAVPDDQRDY